MASVYDNIEMHNRSIFFHNYTDHIQFSAYLSAVKDTLTDEGV